MNQDEVTNGVAKTVGVRYKYLNTYNLKWDINTWIHTIKITIELVNWTFLFFTDWWKILTPFPHNISHILIAVLTVSYFSSMTLELVLGVCIWIFQGNKATDPLFSFVSETTERQIAAPPNGGFFGIISTVLIGQQTWHLHFSGSDNFHSIQCVLDLASRCLQSR